MNKNTITCEMMEDIKWEETERCCWQYWQLSRNTLWQKPDSKCPISRVVWVHWIYPPSNSLSFCFLTSSSSRFRLASNSFRCLSSSSFRCFQTVYSLCFASEICCNLAFWPVNCWALVARSCMEKSIWTYIKILCQHKISITIWHPKHPQQVKCQICPFWHV